MSGLNANAASGLPERMLGVLRRLPLFAGLSSEAISGLIGGSLIHRYPSGTVLFLQDEPASCFYILLTGWVTLYRADADGSERVLRVVAPGESFAEAAIFATACFPVGAQVVEDAELLVIRAEPFLARLRADSDLALKMLAALSQRMRYLVGRIDQLQAVPAPKRLAQFLLRIGERSEGGATIRLPYEKSLIAAHLGMQPETLSRAFARLRAVGVRTSGHEVTIADPAALRQFCGGHARPG